MSNNTRLTVATPTESSIITDHSLSVSYNADFAIIGGYFVIPAGTYGQGNTLFTLPYKAKKSFSWILAYSTTIGTSILRVRSNGVVEFNTNITLNAQAYIFVNGVVF